MWLRYDTGKRSQEVLHYYVLISLYLNKDESTVFSEPFSILEIKAYIGLLLLFGVLKKRHVDIQEIWSPGNLHHFDYATSAMSRFILNCTFLRSYNGALK